jgi:aryl-alcohol dehydrogenase-like predicted oxidoreductase
VSVEKVEQALKAIEFSGVQSVQIIYNLFRQRPAELLFEQTQKRGVGILARLPLSSGLLSGKMSAQSTFAEDDHRAFNREGAAFDKGETFSGLGFNVGLQAVEAMRPLVPQGQSMAQMALRWIQMNPAVTCSIPGGKRAAQVADNVAAADLSPLTDAAMQALADIYVRFAKPQVHQRW